MVKEGNRRGRPRGATKSVPKDFKNRFEKYYYAHRERINELKRLKYEDKVRRRICVYCGRRRASKGSVFCWQHLGSHKPVIEKMLKNLKG